MNVEYDQEAFDLVKKSLVRARAYDLLARLAKMEASGQFSADADIQKALAKDNQVANAFQRLSSQKITTITARTVVPASEMPRGEAAPVGPARVEETRKIEEPPLPDSSGFRRSRKIRHFSIIYYELGNTFYELGSRHLKIAQIDEAHSFFNEAAKAYQEAIRYYPTCLELYEYLADALAIQDKVNEAFQVLLEVIPKDLRRAERFLPKLHAWLTPSRAQLAQSIELTWQPIMEQFGLDASTSASLYHFMGRVQLYLERYDRSATHFQRALSFEPKNLYAMEGLGKSLWKLGRLAEAEALFQQAIAETEKPGQHARKEKILRKLTEFYLEKGDIQKAIPVIQEALALRGPLRMAFQIDLGKAYLKLGQFGEARQAAQSALTQDSSQASAHWILAEALCRMGKFVAAEKAANQALAIEPEHHDSIRTKAEALIGQGKEYDQAIRLLEIFTQRVPSDADGWKLLAIGMRNQNRPVDEVNGAIQKGLEVASKDQRLDLLLLKADLFLHENQLDEVEKILAQVDLDGQVERTALEWQIRGEFFQRKGNYEEALKHFQNGLLLDAENLNLKWGAAEALSAAGRFDQAAEAWRSLIITGENIGVARLKLARVLRDMEDWRGALRAVEGALESSLDGSDEVDAYELQGDALLGLRRPARRAAEAYFIAGRSADWKGYTDRAISLYRKVLSINPKHDETHWRLADMLLNLSYQDNQMLAESLRIWNEGIKNGLPDKDSSWTYLTRALIGERMGQQKGVTLQQYEETLWETITYGERAVLLNPYYSLNWGYLGSFYRTAGHYLVALAAIEKALELDEKSLFFQGEKVALLENLGKFDEVEKLLEQLLTTPADPFFLSIKAYASAHQDKLEEALQILDQLIQKEPENLWNRYNKADILVRKALKMDEQGIGWQKAFEAFHNLIEVYEKSNTGSINDLSILMSAYIWIGDYEKARPYYEEIHSLKIDDSDSLCSLGLCLLGTGKRREGEKLLLEGIRQKENLRDLADSEISYYLPIKKGWLRLPYNDKDLERLLDKIQRAFNEQKAAVASREITDEDEIQAELQRSAGRRKKESWFWQGAFAAMGRIYSTQERYFEALDIYRQLKLAGRGRSIRSSRFPEAVLGIQACSEKLISSGDEDFQKGELEAALSTYRKAYPEGNLELVEAKDLADIFGRIALARLLLEGPLAGLEGFRETIGLYRRSGNTSPGTTVGEVWRSLAAEPQTYWTALDWLRTRESDSSADEEERSTVRETRLAFIPGLEDAYRLNQTGDELQILVTTPIVLEVGDDIVPVVDSALDGGKFLFEEIPAMRGRIEKEMGVTIPGVRARGKPGSEFREQFFIQIDEVPQGEGRVHMGTSYFPGPIEKLSESGIPEEGLEKILTPGTGQTGAWIPGETAERLRNSGIEIWTEAQFIISSLEAIIRQNLASFLGVTEVETLLRSYQETSGAGEQIGALLKDGTSKIFFARLLRTLVKEDIPVRDIGAILATISNLDLEPGNMPEAIRQVRQTVKADLPGNLPGKFCYSLPTEWEQKIAGWLRPNGERLKFDPPPLEAHEFFTAIELILTEKGPNNVLIVQSPEVRPYLRRLLEYRYPELAVMAAEELVQSPAGDFIQEARA
ncbi:MAG TPA: tetratricopeptide repeat protein [Anaerolineaceae bacterium]|nr:tetratricopeptide repeat protein [Anaerolineaceae bacterium]